MPDTSGACVVLTADRSLMAAYSVLLDGMVASSQTTTTPWPVMDRLLMPRAAHPEGRALFAPAGLRRIQAALLAGGFTDADVAVVDDAHLRTVIGPDTRIIGVSTGEPAGLGMSSTTMTAVAGGRIYPQVLLEQLLRRIHRLRGERAPGARIILGGPGAWQLAGDGAARLNLGVDHVVTGYAEANAAEVFSQLLEGGALPPVIAGLGAPPEAVPPMVGAAAMGSVEVSRGCGMGCCFCTLSTVPMAHLPIETVLADVRTNLSAGLQAVALLSEDILRYGARGLQVQPARVIDLLRCLRECDGLRFIQADHAGIHSVGSFSDAELAEVAALLAPDAPPQSTWVNVGVETASGRLMHAAGCAPKMGGTPPDRWGEYCAMQLERLGHAGFTPMASLVVGLPGETPEDLRQTLEWVRGLRGMRATVFPVLYAPTDGSEPLRGSDLHTLHWQLIRECYQFNFRWMPALFSSNQALGGVGALKRGLLQAMGLGQAALWRSLLAYRQWRSAQ